MSNLLNISVTIADRPYRLKVKPEEEANVREAAKMINDKITEYSNAYHANDKQDYLAMVALLYTSENIKKGAQQISVSDTVEATLDEVDALLENLSHSPA
ncbi:MAG: cell division protein ZapA [Saprospiraceae bacterium]|nr:cell division protein ZapA [Saprospiraceae bacterium]